MENLHSLWKKNYNHMNYFPRERMPTREDHGSKDPGHRKGEEKERPFGVIQPLIHFQGCMDKTSKFYAKFGANTFP